MILKDKTGREGIVYDPFFFLKDAAAASDN